MNRYLPCIFIICFGLVNCSRTDLSDKRLRFGPAADDASFGDSGDKASTDGASGEAQPEKGAGGSGTEAGGPKVKRFEGFSDRTINEGDTLEIIYSSDFSEVTCVSCPAEAKVESSERAVRWTPNYDQAGTYDWVVKYHIGEDSHSAIFKVTVKDANRPPVFALLIAQSIQEAETFDYTISAKDPEGTTVKYDCKKCPEGLALDDRSGRILWTPSATQTGNQKLELTATDGDQQTSEAVLSVNVGDVDQSPKFSVVNPKEISELDTLKFQLSAVDPDGKAVTYSCKEGCPAGLVTSKEGAVSWTPTYVQAGDYDIVFAASDGAKEGTVLVSVGVNDTPMYGAVAVSIAESTVAWKFGYGRNQKTRDLSVIDAVKNCGAESCELEYAFVNSCAAVATNSANSAGNGGYSTALAADLPSRKEAEKAALKECNIKATNLGQKACSILNWSCSGVSPENELP